MARIVAGDRPKPKRRPLKPTGLRRGGVYEPDRGGQGTPKPSGPTGNDKPPARGGTAKTGSASGKPPRSSSNAKGNMDYTPGRTTVTKNPKKAPTYSGKKAKTARRTK